MVVPTYTREVEVGELQIQDQPGLRSKTLCQKMNKQKKPKQNKKKKPSQVW
jgi:hypothetical protein